jgi:hypothetical protein
MKEEVSLNKLYTLIEENKKGKDQSTLCGRLRRMELPRNPIQRLEYLMKERELLIQIVSYYQIECKVNVKV